MSVNLSAPALAAPEGQVSILENPPNDNGLALGALILMLAIATLFFCIRFYGKVFIIRKIEVEDVSITLAFVMFLVTFWTDMMFMKYPGYFVHTWNVSVRTEIQATYYVFLFGVFYSVALASVKIAIPLEWCRIFVVPGTWNKSYFWWGAMFVVALQGSFLIVILVLLNVQCIPHEAIWDLTLQATAQCIPLTTLQKLSASIHLISDIFIFLLPQKVIFNLNMSVQKRLGLAVVFSLGVLGVVCSVFRLVDTLQLAHESDAMFYTGPVILWCTAEITCGFFVACAPILPRVVKETPLLRRMFGGTTRGTSSKNQSLGLQTIGGSGAPLSARKRQTDIYSQLDDDNLPPGELKATESTEHLRTAAEQQGMGGIMRTTKITVAHDDEESGSRPGRGDALPWVR